MLSRSVKADYRAETCYVGAMVECSPPVPGSPVPLSRAPPCPPVLGSPVPPRPELLRAPRPGLLQGSSVPGSPVLPFLSYPVPPVPGSRAPRPGLPPAPRPELTRGSVPGSPVPTSRAPPWRATLRYHILSTPSCEFQSSMSDEAEDPRFNQRICAGQKREGSTTPTPTN